MRVGKSVRTVTRQRIVIIRRSIFTVKPSLVPILRMAMEFCMRKTDIFSLLNRNTAQFGIGPVYKLSTAVKIEKVPE